MYPLAPPNIETERNASYSENHIQEGREAPHIYNSFYFSSVLNIYFQFTLVSFSSQTVFMYLSLAPTIKDQY